MDMGASNFAAVFPPTAQNLAIEIMGPGPGQAPNTHYAITGFFMKPRSIVYMFQKKLHLPIYEDILPKLSLFETKRPNRLGRTNTF